MKAAKKMKKNQVMVVCLSGRGDKDVTTAQREVIEGVATFDEWPWSMDRRRHSESHNRQPCDSMEIVRRTLRLPPCR